MSYLFYDMPSVVCRVNDYLDYEELVIESGVKTELPHPGYGTYTILLEPIDGFTILSVEVEPPEEYVPGGGSLGLNFSEGSEGIWKSTYKVDEWNADISFVVTITGAGGGGGDVTTISPFNRLYVMDSESLDALGEVSITLGGEGGANLIDLSQFILKLINIPFKLPEEFYPNESSILLGSHDTGVNAPRLETDVLVFDFGEIVVPDDGELVNHSFTYDLHLPYISEVVQLEPSQVLGETLRVSMALGAYAGDYTITVYNSGDLPISVVIGTLGMDVPIKLAKEVFNNIGAMQGVYNDVSTAYIRVTKPILIDSKFTNLITSTGELDGLVGYVEVLQGDFEFDGGISDRDELLGLLKNGVIIK